MLRLADEKVLQQDLGAFELFPCDFMLTPNVKPLNGFF